MANLIAARAFITLKNQAGNQVAVFDDFLGLSITRTVNDVSSYEFTIGGGDARRLLFELDGQIEIRRSIPGIMDWYLEFEGLHRSISKTLGDDGKITFASRGFGYNDLLARTIVAYKAGTIRAAKNCSAETAMKEFVTENCTIAADTTVVGRLTGGYLPGFSVEPDKTAIATHAIQNWSGDKAYENLLDVLKEIATLSGIDFAVIGTGPAQFEFVSYLEQMGKNRTYTAIDSAGKNEYGNTPVVFAASFGSLQSAEYSHDRSAESNVIVVQGKGDASTKYTLTREDAIARAASPWNRREVSRSASSSEFEYQLRDFGDQSLKELVAKKTITFNPLQTSSLLYGRDYGLGDKITVLFDEEKLEKRIVGVTLSYSEKGEGVSLDLADIP